MSGYLSIYLSVCICYLSIYLYREVAGCQIFCDSVYAVCSSSLFHPCPSIQALGCSTPSTSFPLHPGPWLFYYPPLSIAYPCSFPLNEVIPPTLDGTPHFYKATLFYSEGFCMSVRDGWLISRHGCFVL